MIQPPARFLPPLSRKLKPTPRQAALAEWRRIHLEAEEKALEKSAKSIANVMPGVLKEIGLDKKRADLEILRVWNHLMDPSVVAHAKPSGLVKGTLFVSVDSNVWHAEIVRYRRKEILQRLQHSFGPDLIQRISFRVGA